MTWDTICIAIVALFLAWDTDRVKPKPYSLGNGDTLMVRITGYEFCPKYCDVDHFHIGHKKEYNCEETSCSHIIYEDRLN